MLMPKSVNKKKLILYLSIIVIMFSGTAFYAYKIFSLGFSGSAFFSPNNFNITEIFLESPDVTSGGKEIKTPIQQAQEKKDLINVGILEDSKYQKLQYNLVETENFKVGKENPFSLN